MPPSQNRDTAVDAKKKSARKQKSKQNKKEQGKCQSVLNAMFLPRGEVTHSKRHRVRGSSSEREEEQTSKRPAAQQIACPEDFTVRTAEREMESVAEEQDETHPDQPTLPYRPTQLLPD